MRTPDSIPVSVWHNSPYGYAVHILGNDRFPLVTLGTGKTPVAAIEAAQERVAGLVRGLQGMHDAEVKGRQATV
jgi:hypothetical protein